MIGEMLRPFRLDQVRTTLRALITRFHRTPSFQRLPSLAGKLHRGWAGIRPIFTVVKSVLSAVRPANNRQQLTGAMRCGGLRRILRSCQNCWPLNVRHDGPRIMTRFGTEGRTHRRIWCGLLCLFLIAGCQPTRCSPGAPIQTSLPQVP